MTEDEAFIRTLVDSPGDDTPRLAYADWLDEQGDPRGHYLRAETRIMRQWRDTRDFGVLLRGMAQLGERGASLDPVWSARVSRSPSSSLERR